MFREIVLIRSKVPFLMAKTSKGSEAAKSSRYGSKTGTNKRPSRGKKDPVKKVASTCLVIQAPQNCFI